MQLTAPLFPGAEATAFLHQHYRYVGKTADFRGTMIPSEAPLLHNQVKLVDPVDRQAHAALVRGLPTLRVSIAVGHTDTKGTVGRGLRS